MGTKFEDRPSAAPSDHSTDRSTDSSTTKYVSRYLAEHLDNKVESEVLYGRRVLPRAHRIVRRLVLVHRLVIVRHLVLIPVHVTKYFTDLRARRQALHLPKSFTGHFFE